MQIFSVRRVLPALLAVVLVFAFSHAAEAGDTQEVNVYSYRQPYLIHPLFKKFTEETGIKVNVIFAEKGLIERIRPKDATIPPMWCARGQASSSTRSASTTVQAHEGAK